MNQNYKTPYKGYSTGYEKYSYTDYKNQIMKMYTESDEREWKSFKDNILFYGIFLCLLWCIASFIFHLYTAKNAIRPLIEYVGLCFVAYAYTDIKKEKQNK